jgi:methylmalonyl-CoA mutase N-terminal domain/subunit
MVKAIEDGYLQRLIADESFRVQKAVGVGRAHDRRVNRFQTDEAPPEIVGYELDEKGGRVSSSGSPR